ncbi:recombinase family protein [Sphingobium sp. Z007]|uniref:recombinase family protein n=1 Tax=Sphingobium sp. Z007 TaxID=627495 RepID=UPI00359C554F
MFVLQPGQNRSFGPTGPGNNRGVGIAASWERERITERTAAGRVQARARGVKFGRKAALTPHQQSEALERLAAGDTQRTVAALFDVSQATISRLVGR